MARLGYTASNEAYPQERFEPLPKGVYQAIIVASEVKDSDKGGQYCKIQWQIIDPQYHGRIVYSQHNIFNHNPQAEQIGRRELQDIGRAVGLDEFEDSEELHGKPCMIKLKIEVDKNGKYADKNVLDGVVMPKPGTASQGNDQQFQRQVQQSASSPRENTTAKPASQRQSSPASNGTRNRASNGVPPAHVAAAATGQAAGVRPAAAAGNTRGNPFAE
jgi:hypothetical protein